MVGRGWTHQDASDQVDVHKWYIQAQRMTQVLRASHSSRAQHKPLRLGAGYCSLSQAGANLRSAPRLATEDRFTRRPRRVC
ncbi:hypothetical protein PCASD_08737 [Puccinia coronata f. sp. avenae]|uniref:Uncharacterized protein n=1 Tax=Puccinia coronata f. sp. avenae TaxID=200324 RepID=A0A2N5TEA2_9BASI|nr:hypothetical protein PCASD_08737 [Puccinia coronata f. sp. avenae]